jgi:hypothetical protein
MGLRKKDGAFAGGGEQGLLGSSNMATAVFDAARTRSVRVAANGPSRDARDADRCGRPAHHGEHLLTEDGEQPDRTQDNKNAASSGQHAASFASH